jgi:aryl-alcohol dehydrogenase-like predicted oxidoreductase
MMQYAILGRSGMEVSRLCLGTMMFGGPADEAEAARIIADARENGVNFIDTANVYEDGRSEEITGRAIKAERDHWVLASKVGVAGRSLKYPQGANLSRRYVVKSIDDSLKRLGTNRIDLYYIHRHDPHTPDEEVVRTFGDLIRSGKILHWALSNLRAWQIAHFVHLCREMGVPEPVAVQPYYNLMNRTPEAELLPACRYFNLGVVPYSPLARGVLSGKYAPGAEPPADSRAGRKDARMMMSEWRPESLAIAERLQRHAAGRGKSIVDYAVAWCWNNAALTSVIAGPRTFEQWRGYFGALDYAWDAGDETLADSLVPPGHPSTPGYTDPMYPVRGRFPTVKTASPKTQG